MDNKFSILSEIKFIIKIESFIRHYKKLNLNFFMSQIKKASQSKPNKLKQPTIKNDFKQLFISSVGKTEVNDGDFQQLEDQIEIQSNTNIQQQQHDDFYVQDEQQTTDTNGIKTKQFWKSMIAPSGSPSISKQNPSYKFSVQKSFGFNSLGRDTIILIQNQILKAVGCLIVFKDKIYTGHNYKITTLDYLPNKKQLISATQGLRPQIFLWNYDHQGNKQLQFVKKFVLGSKFQPIYAVEFFKQDYIVAVQKFTLHKNSTLFLINKQTQAKLQIKVGKFYDMEVCTEPSKEQKNQNSQSESQDGQRKKQNQKLFFANQLGIFQLTLQNKKQQQNKNFSKESLSTQSKFQSPNISCLCPFYDNRSKKVQIIYGDKQGHIFFINKDKKVKVHNGWIFQIKTMIYQNYRYFFALGAIDLMFSVMKYDQSGAITVIKKLELGGYGRSIYCQEIPENYKVMVGKRDGNYQIFQMKNLLNNKNQKNQKLKGLSSMKCFQSKQSKKQYILYDQTTCSYIYGNQKSKNISFFKNQLHFHQLSLNYALRYFPKTLDVKKNFIAYTYDVEKQQSSVLGNTLGSELSQDIVGKTFGGSSSNIYSKKQQSKQNKFDKSVLLLEDYTKKKALIKLVLNIQENDKKQQQQMNIENKRCTCIKLHTNCQFIVLGYKNGKLGLCNLSGITKTKSNNNKLTQNQQSTNQSNLSQIQPHLHKEQILEIIFSKDGKFIKTISKSEVYFWKVQSLQNNQSKSKNKDQITIKNIKFNQSKQVNWAEMGKFSWDTKSIWQAEGLVDDIYKLWAIQSIKTDKSTKNQIQSEKNKIIVCSMNDGVFKLYNWPSNSKYCQKFKINDSKVQICPVNGTQNGEFKFWIVFSGMLILMKVFV